MIAINTKTDFYGATYEYATPNNGKQTIGVTEVLGGRWAVCWINDNGSKHRVKTSNLPVVPHPDGLQKLLDVWAKQRGLKMVEEFGPDRVSIPVVGYANCTGHPLPGDAENSKRIQAFLDEAKKGASL